MSGNRSLDEFAEPESEEGADGRRTGEGAAAAETAGGETATEEPSAEETATAGSATEETATAGSATEETATADSEPATEVVADGERHEAPDPPASTYVWRPDGGACADCGETVEERWRDGDDLVCAGCKEW